MPTTTPSQNDNGRKQIGQVLTVIARPELAASGELPPNLICLPMQLLASPEPIRSKRHGKRQSRK